MTFNIPKMIVLHVLEMIQLPMSLVCYNYNMM